MFGLGKLIPTIPSITFQGQPAKVEEIDFDVTEGQIIIRIADGRRLRVRLQINSVTEAL
jgi:hypothetical protein